MTDHAAPLRAPLEDLATDAAFPRDLRAIAADAMDAQDVEAVMARAGKAIVALEDHTSRGEHLAKQIREALLTVMVETGAPSFSTGEHTVGVSETRRVHVTDMGALPEKFVIHPPPKADTQALGDALRKGETVAGAELGNGVPSLFIRRSKR